MKRLFTALIAICLIMGLVGCDLFSTTQPEDPFVEVVNTFEGSVDVIPHYYAQLTDTEKAAYASIVTTINASGDVASVPAIDAASLEAVTRAVSYDNPQFLWLSKKWTITHYAAGTASITIPYLYTAAERQEMVDALERVAEQIMRGINSVMSDYDKELYIHNYLVSSCSYDSSALSQEDFNNSYTAYGALVEGRAVCEGYARAMQYMLDKVGIESYLVTGTSYNQNGQMVNHMWNAVRIDSEWYHLDSTWNDPSGEALGAIWHSYFNLTDEEIRRDHFFTAKTDCTETKANYHRKNMLYFNDYNSSELADQLADEFYTAKRKGTCFVELRFSDQISFNEARAALLGKNLIRAAVNRAYNRYGTRIDASLIYYSTNDTQLVIGIKF